jgi:hypothetical protein
VPVAIALVGGTRLAKGRWGITLDSPEYRGEIVRVDRRTETIKVAPAPPDPAAMAGAQVFLGNPDRRVVYKVLEVKAAADGVELRLAGDSRIGVGRATGVAPQRIQTDSPFALQRFRYYHGARVINAAASAEYRMIDARSARAVFLDAEVHPDAKADKLAGEFPAGSWFEIYDYGVGDEVVWPYPVNITRQPDGQYRITAPVPVRADLP